MQVVRIDLPEPATRQVVIDVYVRALEVHPRLKLDGFGAGSCLQRAGGASPLYTRKSDMEGLAAALRAEARPA